MSSGSARAAAGSGRVALVYPGDRAARRNPSPAESRFADLFRAFAEAGIQAEPAPYHDDLCDEVRDQLLGVDVALVWINPIDGGRDRSRLDAMLREVAAAGTFVSTHPDVILALGTKDVLFATRDLGWGSDVHRYASLEAMRRELPARLASGAARVLKQHRGNGGLGVFKVELAAMRDGLAAASEVRAAAATLSPPSGPETLVRVRQAVRGAREEVIRLEELYRRCEVYFAGDGRLIDQAYQERLSEGMVRCYLVQGEVVGFGRQAINALFPSPPGTPPGELIEPGPRYYHPATVPELQSLKRRLETEWVPGAQRLLGLESDRLPILWDCDFLLGPREADGRDTWVLCEINVSSVAPYPESAVPRIVEATQRQLGPGRPAAPFTSLR